MPRRLVAEVLERQFREDLIRVIVHTRTHDGEERRSALTECGARRRRHGEGELQGPLLVPRILRPVKTCTPRTAQPPAPLAMYMSRGTKSHTTHGAHHARRTRQHHLPCTCHEPRRRTQRTAHPRTPRTARPPTPLAMHMPRGTTSRTTHGTPANSTCHAHVTTTWNVDSWRSGHSHRLGTRLQSQFL